MRISRYLTPVAILGVLALAGCEGGATADGKGKAGPSTSSSASSSASPSAEASAPTAAPDPVMPALVGRTFQQAKEELARLNISDARITPAALHNDVVLPQDHSGWTVCVTSPSQGTTIAPSAGITLKLAEKSGDCSVSYHGFLDQKNDPAYTPPATTAPAPAPTSAAPKPKPTYSPEPERTPAATKPAPGGGGSSMITCSDGKQGYACTSNGHPVVDGQFCPNADRGRTAKATNGTTVTCSYDASVKPYRWQ